MGRHIKHKNAADELKFCSSLLFASHIFCFPGAQHLRDWRPTTIPALLRRLVGAVGHPGHQHVHPAAGDQGCREEQCWPFPGGETSPSTASATSELIPV